MDIHRCRFVEYTPSAINALAFSHSSGKTSRDQPLRLAVGRANGNIEVWDPKKGTWIHELTLYGGRGRSVDGLAWVQDPDEIDDTGFVSRGRLRLFSIGYSSTVTEWDLITGLPLRDSGGNHSEVWCLAAQPACNTDGTKIGTEGTKAEHRGQDLVAGCADGSLVLLSTADNALTFKRIISRAGKKAARALSISFQSRNIVIVGFADSSVRVYNISNGTMLRNISVGGGARGGPKETLIWAVECLRDGTIVVGDSNGEISFWDGKTFGQLQRIKAHEADILCLASSADGQTVLSSGIDRRTCVYSLVEATGPKRRWAKIAHKRFHRHDVKAMARFENSKMSVVVSGGLDTTPVLIPLRNFEKEYHRQLPFVPQCSPVTGSQRIVATWQNNEVAVWQIGGRQAALKGLLAQDETNYKLLVKMTLKGEENITSASLSASGRILAVSTVAQTSLFYLRPNSKDGEKFLSISKLKTPAALYQNGGRLTQFSPDSRWLLIVKCDGDAQLCRILENTDAGPSVVPTAIVLPRLERSEGKKLQNCLSGHWGSYDRTLVRAAFSSDGRICAASDLGGRIDTWILEGQEDFTAPAVDHVSASRSQAKGNAESDSDSDNALDHDSLTAVIYGQRWICNPCGTLLPRLPSTPLILSFRLASKSSALGIDESHHSDRQDFDCDPIVYPTSHIPQTHPHFLPSYPTCEDRLLALSAGHELFEFHAISGKLTDWSRSNPPSFLPDQFKLQRDRAVGAVWDASRERVWIYSATWLAMFDLRLEMRGLALNQSIESAVTNERSNTMPSVSASGSSAVQKRRRPSATAGELATSWAHTRAQMNFRRNLSGIAGSEVKQEDKSGIASMRKIRKLTANGEAEALNESPATRERNIFENGENDSDDDSTARDGGDDYSGVPDVENLTLHKGITESKSNARHLSGVDDLSLAVHQDEDADADAEGLVPFYLTTRYRQILGLVALQPEDKKHGADDGYGSLEVALLERPFASLDLGPRFVGGQEWDR